MAPMYADSIGGPKLEQEAGRQITYNSMSPLSPLNTMRLRSEDSWIEISSQPSSSSLSSQANNDIITTGLNVRSGDRLSRHGSENVRPTPARSTSVASSSQDEYEESESESDRVLASSNEEIQQLVEDRDEVATGRGFGRRDVFTPQPNAFSHPPQLNHSRSTPTPNSYFPARPLTSHSERSSTTRALPQHGGPSRSARREAAPTTRPQPDHDAALRASLTTLISCAAAIRPPKDTKDHGPAHPIQTSQQPTALRLVCESELDSPPRTQKYVGKRRSRESSKERQAKKIRALKSQPVSDEVLSPTMMTWMISAGVVLVFSAISFSAGYAWGKEVGRFEGEMGISTETCAREALKSGGGLRRLRWSAAAQSVRA